MRARRFSIILVIVLTGLAYANSLSNGFVGDDVFLFGNNQFYKDPANIARVFSKDFVMSREDLNPAMLEGPPSLSGCVAYRPVVALSFFADYGVWKDNPFGFHLTNLFLHILTALSVFGLLVFIFKNEKVALLAALLFALHPVQSEAVNSIGYRSDLLATLFFVLSFWALARVSTGKFSWPLMLGGMAAFVLALFSKETAVTLPFVLAAYHWLIAGPDQKKVSFRKLYGALAALTAFYLYLYFFVFSNVTFGQSRQMLGLAQFLITAKALAGYLTAFVLPQKVAILPSFHPFETRFFPGEWLALGAFAAALIGLIVYARKQRTGKVLLFFAMWFILTWLPASNVVALPSPFAYRFVYLPSIGLMAIAAFVLQKFFDRLTEQSGKNTIELLLKGALLVILMSFCFPLNRFYRDNVIFYRKQIEYYPRSAHPYLLLGSMYRNAGAYEKAIEYYQIYYVKRPVDPAFDVYRPDYEILTQIGTCYVNNPDKAIEFFTRALQEEPNYLLARVNLIRAYMIKGEQNKAGEEIEAALKIFPGEPQLLEMKEK